MQDHELFKGFHFRLLSFEPKHHVNHSCGAPHHYLGYLHQGTARMVSDEVTLELKEGDLFYIPKGCRYRSCWRGENGIRFESFAFEAIPQQEGANFALQVVPVTPKVNELIEDLARDRTVNPRSVSILYRLLWEVMPTLRHAAHQKGDALARKIAYYITEHPDEGVDQVARSLGVSESTLYHVVKEKLNKTPNHLRQEAKCRQAISLLTCTDLSVEEVSSRLGFSSSSYMRKLLRAATGKTPLQIRAEAQNL